jgi:hypothetical protein
MSINDGEAEGQRGSYQLSALSLLSTQYPVPSTSLRFLASVEEVNLGAAGLQLRLCRLQVALIEGFPDSVKKLVFVLHGTRIVLHSLSSLALASAQPFQSG